MVVASTLRGVRGGSGRQLVIRDQLESLLLPASKAYLLGYIMDVLPAILKALIKFVTAELARIRKSEKRLREERSLASSKPRKRNQLVESIKPILSSLHRLPLLLKAIAKALLVALGMRGMAISCFLAMAGWRISEVLVWWPLAKYYALKLTSSAADEKAVKSALTYARVTSTFVASALSSAGAMMMLQHQSASALRKKQIQSTSGSGKDLLTIDTTPGWIPRSLRPSNLGFLGRRMAVGERQQPRFASLAPAGHFLSRLTSLTVPGTPGLVAPGGGGGSPGLVPASPESRSSALPVSPTAGTMLQPPEATGDAPPASPVLPAAPQLKVSEVDAKPTSTALGRPSPTIDLTLFALVRGLDTLVRALASTPTTTTLKQTATATRSSPTLLSRLASGIATQADGFIFVICCAQIMWAWFYHPERLPPTYVKWITNLATMDERLLLALRCIRHGKPLVWNYQSKAMTAEGVHLLGSLAEELGHPYQWGDPTRLPNTSAEAKKMIQEARRKEGKEGEFVLDGAAGARGRGEMGGMPCELVHCGAHRCSAFRRLPRNVYCRKLVPHLPRSFRPPPALVPQRTVQLLGRRNRSCAGQCCVRVQHFHRGEEEESRDGAVRGTEGAVRHGGGGEEGMVERRGEDGVVGGEGGVRCECGRRGLRSEVQAGSAERNHWGYGLGGEE
ncbi:hypothetical protein PHSY_002295 [Pseudozyma hubeiensis SY62]|uniref:Uncharacterized protein n=1 Tax=Pseudozyma hubeiensis (strain SY62) TaxID=1305764 RepID=R9P0V9_PSEHS|nr:hypothetical protein PHSY_002295 [Pseudozyma hubeiensis SY62]GAC94722.1 hypothetical protein PHSY_002295 [Pseudozyma hubeiensis SY62]